jgi:hypothetical protein
MNERAPDETSCASCRWVGFWAQPYGALEYFCSRRQEAIPSAALARRRCLEFDR